MGRWGDGAILHDKVETGAFTFDDLRRAGQDIIEIADTLPAPAAERRAGLLVHLAARELSRTTR